jgi:hypothetical protein
MWAVITWKRELYYYKHGYVRTSSDSYSLDNNTDSVHLTNNCLQKYKDKYGCFEEGNTLGLDVLEKYITEQYPSFSINRHIMPRIKDLMIDSFLSVKNEINPGDRRNCFELLGFDFMIDEDLRTWLIEVNTNPYLGVPNKFIEGLLPKMLNDLFTISLDPYIRNPNRIVHSGNVEFILVELKNQFELLYCDKKRVNKRRNYDLLKVYPLAERSTLKSEFPFVFKVGSNKKRVSSARRYKKLIENIKESPDNVNKSLKPLPLLHTRQQRVFGEEKKVVSK